MSSAEKWKMKKLGKLANDSNESMTSFLKLTELANNIMETGNMDIYQETFEMIKLKVNLFFVHVNCQVYIKNHTKTKTKMTVNILEVSITNNFKNKLKNDLEKWRFVVTKLG